MILHIYKLIKLFFKNHKKDFKMVQTTTPQDASQWLANGEAILIDVREPDEFQAEHIAYAVSLPLSKINDLFSQLQIPPERKIIFQCLSGKRGSTACVNLKAAGACNNDIYNMEGGIAAWKDANLPIVGGAQSLSICRQVQIIIGGLIALMVLLGSAGLSFGFMVAGFFGAALCFAGITGWCGLAMLLKKMPWNT